MCGFNEGGDIFHQVCTVTEMISDSKVKLKTLVDVMCVFCVIATVYLVSILGTLRYFFNFFWGGGRCFRRMWHLCFSFMHLAHISVASLWKNIFCC